MVVSIMREETKSDLEKIFDLKTKEVKDSSRTGGASKTNLSWDSPSVVMSATKRGGMSSQVVIHELIQLV